jgi:hypothetical protein
MPAELSIEPSALTLARKNLDQVAAGIPKAREKFSSEQVTLMDRLRSRAAHYRVHNDRENELLIIETIIAIILSWMTNFELAAQARSERGFKEAAQAELLEWQKSRRNVAALRDQAIVERDAALAEVARLKGGN